jgi:hypothetical protein
MRSRTSRFRGLCIGSTVFLATLAGAEEGAPAAPVEGAESSEAQTKPDAPSIDPDVETIVILEAKSEPSTDFSVGDSVTGFGAEDLAALGAQDVADLASFTPNLEIVTAGATTPTFFIRGVGLNDFNPNSTGAVAIYRDGVAINAPAIQLATLFDVQAVNVLRGPQGTGLARNASAGAIKIYSRKPTGDFGGFLRADFGDFGYQDYEGALEVPLHRDVLATRLAFRLSKRDGTMKNRCGNAAPPDQRNPYELGGIPVDPKWSICGEPVSTVGQVSTIPVGLEETVNNLDNWAARGTLLFEPTLEMSWLLSAHGSRRDEVTRLGQAIGTGSDFCTDPTKVCNPPFAGVPPELRDRAGQSGASNRRSRTAWPSIWPRSSSPRSWPDSSTPSPGKVTSTTPDRRATTPTAATSRATSGCPGTSTSPRRRATTPTSDSSTSISTSRPRRSSTSRHRTSPGRSIRA